MTKQKELLFEKHHFELFQKEAWFWATYFGLLDFDIQFKLSEKNDTNLASTVVYHADKLAVITVTKFWDELNDQKIKSTAFHEIVELLS